MTEHPSWLFQAPWEVRADALVVVGLDRKSPLGLSQLLWVNMGELS